MEQRESQELRNPAKFCAHPHQEALNFNYLKKTKSFQSKITISLSFNGNFAKKGLLKWCVLVWNEFRKSQSTVKWAEAEAGRFSPEIHLPLNWKGKDFRKVKHNGRGPKHTLFRWQQFEWESLDDQNESTAGNHGWHLGACALSSSLPPILASQFPLFPLLRKSLYLNLSLLIWQFYCPRLGRINSQLRDGRRFQLSIILDLLSMDTPIEVRMRWCV